MLGTERIGVGAVDQAFDRWEAAQIATLDHLREQAAEPRAWLPIVLAALGIATLAGGTIWAISWLWHRWQVWLARRARSPPV